MKNLTREEKQQTWIKLTQQALKEGVAIRPNNRFTYQGKKLGGFLFRVKRQNNIQVLQQLEAIGFDYDACKKNSIREKKYQTWLSLLKECIDDPHTEIQVNHRFKYKGKNLGTFLVGARTNTELKKRMRKLGFSYSDYLRKPNLYAKRFIKDLIEAKPKDKPKFITRFYTYVLPKKELINDANIEKINELWKLKFNSRRLWRYPIQEEQRIVQWKRFRYDKEKNPTEKWLQSRRIMGDIFNFAYRRKRKPNLMYKIKDYFSKEEIAELKKEGFLNK